MDRELWMVLTRFVDRAIGGLPRPPRRTTYSDRLIIRMFLWAVWHDRPMCWACDRGHYGALFRPRRLPSVSQFSRRRRSARCGAILQRLHDLLAAGFGPPAGLSFLDGKPLPVSECTKDKDAKSGRGAGRFSRGYRLHAWISADGRVPVWAVTAMNVQEQAVAHLLLHGRHTRGLLLADGNDDGGPLYSRVHAQGGVLLTPQRRAGHAERTRRPMPEPRRWAIEAWRTNRAQTARVYALRRRAESTFANATCFGGGLGPLPAWVRTLPRVRRWVGVKLCIYHARLRVRRHLVA